MKWSAGMGIIAFPIILVVGFVVLDQNETKLEWVLPWAIYGIASVFAFINSMLLSYIEGCNSVGEVQKIRFYISFITVLSTVILLFIGSSLYALAISLFLGALSGTILIVNKYGNMLKQLYAIGIKIVYNWKNEVLPLIGKYAVSWISGYFIFSIFTPIAFHYYGVIEAGKIGLSIAVCTAIFGISNIWMRIVIPKINMLVAQKDYTTLNKIFKKHLTLSIASYIVGTVTLFIIVTTFKEYLPFEERLVSISSLGIITTGWLLQVIISGYAVYMRAHKDEPLMFLSFISGVYISLTTLLIAIYLPFEYFFLGFLSSYLWSMPWTIIIFKKYIKGLQ